MEDKKDKKDKKTETSASIDVQVDVPVEDAVQDLPTQEVQQCAEQPKITVKKRFQVEIYDKVSYGEPPMEQIKLEKVHYDNPVIIEAASKKDLQDFGEKLALCKQTFKIVKVLDDVPIQQAPIQQQMQSIQQPVAKVQAPIRSKPKYYKIGNIEIKDDNGKIYQKQWLKLTDEEMSNFRIVNNKTNAIVALKDKSIEMKKWVLVETSEDTSTTLEENLK